MLKVYFASDHAGFALKNALVEYVRALGYGVASLERAVLDSNAGSVFCR